MPRSTKAVSFDTDWKADVKVTRLPFKAFASARHLDIAKLARAKRAVVELGYFESDCCKRVVRGTIANGKLVSIDHEPCEHGEADAKAKKDPRVAKLLAAAKAKLGPKGGRARKLPIALARQSGGGSFGGLGDIIDIDIPEQWCCYRICITILWWRWCFTCCVGSSKLGSYVVC